MSFEVERLWGRRAELKAVHKGPYGLGAIKIRFRFSGSVAKFRQATRSFLMSVCLSVCPFNHPTALLSVRMEQLGSHSTDLHEIWYFSVFRSSVEKIQVSRKSDKSNRYLIWTTTNMHYNISLNLSLNEKWFRQKLYRKPKHTLQVQQLFPRKSCRLWDNVEKYQNLSRSVMRSTQPFLHCFAFPGGKILWDMALTLRWLTSYIYGAPILDVSRSHTTTQHSR